MQNANTLKELRDDIRHMDNSELLAFGRARRSSPQSDEYREAREDWQRRRREQREKATPPSVPQGPTSAEFSAMAATAPPGRYPWKRND